MRRSLFILFGLGVFLLNAYSQDFDRSYLSQQDIAGTARYVSMAGAFSALGGDVSAVKDNPAALGVFRHSEISLSLDEVVDEAQVNTDRSFTYATTLSQLSWVINWRNDSKQKGALSHSLFLGYHRLNTYNRDAAYNGNFSTSQTDVMALLADKQSISALNSYDAWYNDTIGWLQISGSQAGLLQTDSAGHWSSLLGENEKVNSRLNTIESGGAHEYSVAWGTNISHKWYVGVGMALRTVNTRKDITYSERFEKGGNYVLQTSLANNGLGWGMTFGAIYRPTNFLRIGLSVLTPTWYTMKFTNTTTMESSEVTNTVYSPNNSYTLYRYQLPMRTTAGLAFQVNTRGLISLEYDYNHHTDTTVTDLHTLKFGTEWVVKNHCFLHAGYAFTSTFHTLKQPLLPAVNSTRTDTDFKHIRAYHYASLGADFRSDRWVVGLAYQFRLEQSDVYAHELQFNSKAPFLLNATTHRIVATFAWKYR